VSGPAQVAVIPLPTLAIVSPFTLIWLLIVELLSGAIVGARLPTAFWMVIDPDGIAAAPV
jgi:hypothetical protein